MHRIGVIVGMQSEAQLANALHPAAIEVSGATDLGAKMAMERLLKTQIDAVVSFGFAGGLDPLIKPGSILLPSVICTEKKDYMPNPFLRLKLGAERSDVKIGALLHSDEAIKSSAEKKKLFQDTACLAVDMESGIVAEYCQKNNIPFAALRVVCDSALRDLPPVACIALSQKGTLNFFSIVNSFLTNPIQCWDLMALGFDASIAYWRLKRYVNKINK
ncbi:5'-methylthioadenosine/S-adenosylhomocysteine nucleosidase [Commensalibacter sp. Nvir]|uniref:phosphorylase family protein n=1 Tax=Commensalibacter sp. Nvir TaxID=3069817 RepID=UPI002D6E91D8|nr:5'-methylthioadenosine/S-adenosylhomocysteine nucleosidase [Commensalibacter sp. Nvir]